MPAGKNLIGYGSATVSTGAITLATDASLPSAAHGCIITIETDSIRWRGDGTPASSTEGHQLAADSSLTFDSWTTPGINWRQALVNLSLIRSSTSDASIRVSYFD